MRRLKQHPFSVDGLSVADVGVSAIDANGNVYHLSKLEDFEGNYTAASAGAAVGGGAGVATMKNANGVVDQPARHDPRGEVQARRRRREHQAREVAHRAAVGRLQ